MFSIPRVLVIAVNCMFFPRPSIYLRDWLYMFSSPVSDLWLCLVLIMTFAAYLNWDLMNRCHSIRHGIIPSLLDLHLSSMFVILLVLVTLFDTSLCICPRLLIMRPRYLKFMTTLISPICFCILCFFQFYYFPISMTFVLFSLICSCVSSYASLRTPISWCVSL